MPANKYAGITTLANPTTILSGTVNANTSGNVATINVTYGARVDNAIAIPAAIYQTTITYTLTANEVVPAPTLSNLILNDTYYTNKTKQFVLAGTNLESTYTNKGIYLVKNGLSPNDEHNRHYATNINTYPNLSNTNKGKQLAFTNPKLTEAGNYDLYVTTKGGTAKLTNALHIIPESTCRNGDPNSDCQVDIDDNMFPIAWDSNNNLKLLTDTDLTTNPGSWYDYNQKKWANAVTFADSYDQSNGVYCRSYADHMYWETANGASMVCVRNGGFTIDSPQQVAELIKTRASMRVDEEVMRRLKNDIIGYWTYIPRYAYEVQRRDATDKYVLGEQQLLNSSYLKNEFILTFEKSTTPKSTPVSGCTLATDLNASLDNAKDYRTECNLNRDYTNKNNSTWATHPAFTFGNTELNGLWVGKFETTGTRTSPTIKPNQHANVNESIGNFYAMAASIGVSDMDNTGGNTVSVVRNSHNLSTYHSHMLKNSEWGAITYLSASTYGAGINNVKNNGAYPTTSADADGHSSRYGITGCGPAGTADAPTNGNYTGGTALNSTIIESSTACATRADHSWTSRIGQLASTTNNIYGIYDMAGGAWEYVIGNRTTAGGQSITNSNFSNPAKLPYVDLYPTSAGFGTKPSWSRNTGEYIYNNDVCAWGTCGGHALHETKKIQSVSDNIQSWSGDYSGFVNSGSAWFLRGGLSSDGVHSGLFSTHYYGGANSASFGYRVVLIQ